MTTESDKTGSFAIVAAGSAAVMLLASIAFVVFQIFAPADRFASCREVQIAGGQKLGGSFELIDHNGNSVTDADVFDRPSLLYFGYTFCPDVCPFDVVRNVDAVELLAERGFEVRPVFVTVDPARDTPEALNDYVFAMSEKLIALTGDEIALRKARASFGASEASKTTTLNTI